MAAVHVYPGAQIADLTAGDFLNNDRMMVYEIIIRSTAAGTFTFVIDGVTLYFDTTAEVLTLVIPFSRSCNSITLAIAPAGAHAYVLLEKRI